MVWMTWYEEQELCWECPGEWNIFIPFVLYEEFFCLKDVVVEVDVVNLKVANHKGVAPRIARRMG